MFQACRFFSPFGWNGRFPAARTFFRFAIDITSQLLLSVGNSSFQEAVRVVLLRKLDICIVAVLMIMESVEPSTNDLTAFIHPAIIKASFKRLITSSSKKFDHENIFLKLEGREFPMP